MHKDKEPGSTRLSLRIDLVRTVYGERSATSTIYVERTVELREETCAEESGERDADVQRREARGRQ